MNSLWHSFIVMMNETTSGDHKFLFIDELNSALIRNLKMRVTNTCEKNKKVYSNDNTVGYNNRLALPYIDSCGKRIKILQAGFVFREPVLIIRL